MGYKVNKIRVGTQQVRPAKWTPSNPYCWYEFNGDYKDNTGSFGNATGTSTFATLTSGQKVLQTDGTNIVLLPSGVTSSAITTYTIAFWMKILTTNPTYGYYLGCSPWTSSAYCMAFYESTSGRNYYEWGTKSGDTVSVNSRDITPSGLTTGWRLVVLRSNGTGRSNVSLNINATNNIATGGTSGPDSSSIFGWNSQLVIGGRNSGATGTGQRTSIQISNFVISHSYWSDSDLTNMYNETKSLYGL